MSICFSPDFLPGQTALKFPRQPLIKETRTFMNREASRKTIARNAFIGKIQEIRKGDIQARVCLSTLSGYTITTVITIGSRERLGLKKAI